MARSMRMSPIWLITPGSRRYPEVDTGRTLVGVLIAPSKKPGCKSVARFSLGNAVPLPDAYKRCPHCQMMSGRHSRILRLLRCEPISSESCCGKSSYEALVHACLSPIGEPESLR